MTCELHDEVSAGSQFVTHLTGRILERLSLRTTPINTKAGAGRWPAGCHEGLTTGRLNQKESQHHLGGGFKGLLIFTATWGNDPI